MVWCCGARAPRLEDEYELGAVLGEGRFAVVRHCTERATGDHYACKQILKEAGTVDDELRAEVEILRKVGVHPNIIYLHAVFETREHLNLVMELATGGELFERISKRGFYTERDAADVVMQLTKALHFMHEHGVTHRDLKPENLLYTDSSEGAQIRVTDFGLANLSKAGSPDELMRTAVGSPTYVAPEILANKGYGKEVDIWSLGIILYILLCGYPPFADSDMRALFRKIQAGQFEFASPHWTPISNHAKDVVRAMLQLDPRARITPAELLQNPWVRQETAPTEHLHGTVQNIQKMARNWRLRKAARAVIATQRMSRSANERQTLSSAIASSSKKISHAARASTSRVSSVLRRTLSMKGSTDGGQLGLTRMSSNGLARTDTNASSNAAPRGPRVDSSHNVASTPSASPERAVPGRVATELSTASALSSEPTARARGADAAGAQQTSTPLKATIAAEPLAVPSVLASEAYERPTAKTPAHTGVDGATPPPPAP